MRPFLWILPFSLFSLTQGCSRSEPAPPITTSTVGGTLSVSSFPDATSGVVATNEAKQRVAVAAGQDGRFSLSLSRGHTYTLAVQTAAGEVPLVFPRSSGQLGQAIQISSGAARFDFGAVHYLAAAPPSGVPVMTSAECEDGVTASGAPCADDGQRISCDSGPNGEDDGECVAGKETHTGAACTDPPEKGSPADPTQPMAVAAHSAPDDVGGCDDHGDGEEQD